MTDDPKDPGRGYWWADCTPRDWRNLRWFMLAFAVWVVTFVGGAWLLRSGMAGAGFVAWLVAALPALTGLLVIVSYGRYLRDTDDFQRMIHFQALALGYGGGWLVGGYRLFELVGAPRADRGTILLVMAGVFALAVLLGRRRYA